MQVPDVGVGSAGTFSARAAVMQRRAIAYVRGVKAAAAEGEAAAGGAASSESQESIVKGFEE